MTKILSLNEILTPASNESIESSARCALDLKMTVGGYNMYPQCLRRCIGTAYYVLESGQWRRVSFVRMVA
jgi:hypothetical protein